MKKITNYIVKSLVPATSVIKFAILGFGLLMSSGASASTVQGGQMIVNLDSDKLAGAFTHNFNPDRPSFYLEEYFDAAQVASRTPAELLNEHIIPGPLPISGDNRILSVNNSNVSGPNKPTNFTFDANDLTGTASGAIGLGGALRYRLNTKPDFSDTGQEEGNRAVTGYMTIEYDPNRTDNNPDWVVFNSYGFRADVWGLENVVTNLTGDTLSLTGDLALAHGFDHLGGTFGTIVGDFNFQTTVVPVPAAVWLFGSALAGLSVARTRREKVTFSN